ncbi:hypothetical protein GGU11DRAFT_760514 [Lentinula aff. detonsa]|nr:hypothetical protein GGU11DRAFT_760514 [Lentinula aff. detonsa]
MLSSSWIIATFFGFFAVLLSSLAVLALPTGPIIVPSFQDASSNDASKHLATDLERRFLSSRTVQAPICRNLTKDEFNDLPGANKLKELATNTWGKGSKLNFNDKDEPGYPAQICAQQQVTIKYSGSPECHTTNATTQGELSGTTGTVAIAVAQGSTLTAQFTVSSAASISLSDTYMASVSFPAIVDVMDASTVNVAITNTQTESFMTQHNDMTTMTLTMSATEGKTCTAIESVKSCTLQGVGELRLEAVGWAGFYYGDPVGDKTDKDKNKEKHYKWFLKIEDHLTLEERSSVVTFNGPITTNTHGGYKGTCS